MKMVGEAVHAVRDPKKSGWAVQISGGQSTAVIHNVKEYELLDLKAGVYHRMTLEDGSLLYVNDFGIRSIHVRPEDSDATSPY